MDDRMGEVKTKFGKCNVEETGVDYQVVAFFSKLDEEDIPELKQYFNKIGKFEEIMKGIGISTNFLGISDCKNMPELTNNDIDDSIEIERSNEPKRCGCIDVFIQGRKLDKYERREFDSERLNLTPEIVSEMISNIEKYELLKKSKIAFDKLYQES